MTSGDLQNDLACPLFSVRPDLTPWINQQGSGHREYNHVRRHSSLGYKTPTEYAETCTCTTPD